MINFRVEYGRVFFFVSRSQYDTAQFPRCRLHVPCVCYAITTHQLQHANRLGEI